MFGTESTDNLYFSVSASQLGNGLDEQLARFVAEHKDTKLIIIDTLQKVREVGGDNYSYANDYQIMARLKSFADAHGLCLLLVHHTRKQNADDKFDMISGTSGLLGAADGAFLLQKEKRTGNAATLEVSGRDQQDQKLYLIRNTETLLWDLQKAETELWKEPPEPLLDEIAELVMKDNPYWEGSPTAISAGRCVSGNEENREEQSERSRNTGRQCGKTGMESDGGCGISRGCSRRRYLNRQAGENHRQNAAINKDTWMAAGYVSADYPRCERLLTGNDFQI